MPRASRRVARFTAPPPGTRRLGPIGRRPRSWRSGPPAREPRHPLDAPIGLVGVAQQVQPPRQRQLGPSLGSERHDRPLVSLWKYTPLGYVPPPASAVVEAWLEKSSTPLSIRLRAVRRQGEAGTTAPRTKEIRDEVHAHHAADAEGIAGKKSSFAEIIAPMGAYNESLIKAGVLLAGEGLADAKEGFVVDFTRPRRSSPTARTPRPRSSSTASGSSASRARRRPWSGRTLPARPRRPTSRCAA